MQFSLFFPHLGYQFVFHDDHFLLFSINRLESVDFIVGRTKIHQFWVEICLCSFKSIKFGQKSLLPFEISWGISWFRCDLSFIAQSYLFPSLMFFFNFSLISTDEFFFSILIAKFGHIHPPSHNCWGLVEISGGLMAMSLFVGRRLESLPWDIGGCSSLNSFKLRLGQSRSDGVQGRPRGSSSDSHTRRDCLVAGLSVVVVAGVAVSIHNRYLN